jgi:transcriptional regulator with XRE-family HTH domain
VPLGPFFSFRKDYPKKERRGKATMEKSTPSVVNRNIGIRLKKVRKTFGLTRDKLCEIMGISISRLSGIERGLRSLDPRELYTLSEKFDIRLDWLIAGEGPKYCINIPNSLKKILLSDDSEAIQDIYYFMLKDSQFRRETLAYYKEIKKKAGTE